MHILPKQVRESEYDMLIQCLPLLTFDCAFHTSLTKHNLCMNLSHHHSGNSLLEHSFIKFLNIESCYSLSHVLHENVILHNMAHTHNITGVGNLTKR